MSRVALIGDNSIQYISFIVDIWNSGDCVVLIDKNTPQQVAIDMMMEAEVTKCIIDQKVINNWDINTIGSIYYEIFDSGVILDSILPLFIYKKFKSNYSNSEAIVVYSSGTTGKSKGIILSHYAIQTNADSIAQYMGLSPYDCFYLVKSLTHSSTLTGELLVALKYKVKIVIAPLTVTPKYILRKIKKHSVTILCLNPTILELLSVECDANSVEYDISTLRRMYVSGSLLSDRLYYYSHKVFGMADIYNVYGLSEAAPRVTAQTKQCCKSNSVGQPIKDVQVCIVNEHGEQTMLGDRGIIHIKTPSIYSGYITGQTKYVSLYRDWLNTGDVGFLDENQELHIVGRIDDVIMIDSHKIYPADVEMTIIKNTSITNCAVVGLKLPDRDILGCMCVGSEIDNSEIVSALKRKLLTYEIPKFYIFAQKLPTNKNGKILRHVVIETLQKELEKRGLYEGSRRSYSRNYTK